MLLLFCPITFVSDNHFRFFFSWLNNFLGDNLKLRLKVSAVIARWGHASLFVENGIVLGKTTGHSRLALLKLVNAVCNETHHTTLTGLVNLKITK
jgi:hypothetical protein